MRKLRNPFNAMLRDWLGADPRGKKYSLGPALIIEEFQAPAVDVPQQNPRI